MRSVITPIVALLLAGCAAPTHSSRQQAGKIVAQERREANVVPSGRHELVRVAIEKYMAAKKVTGASVAITKDGKLDFAQGFGYADLENDVDYQSETVNRLASAGAAKAGGSGVRPSSGAATCKKRQVWIFPGRSA